MQSPDFERQYVVPSQSSEITTSDRGSSKKRRVIAATVASVGLVASACGVSHSAVKTAPRATTTTVRPHKPSSPETTTTTTTTTVPPQVAYPSGKFIGAIELVRKGPQETNPADATVIHRLNTGIWNSTPAGESVDAAPMLDYGPVFNQNSAPFGTLGDVSLISAHDVTPITAPVTLNGTTYNQHEVTHSLNAEPVAGNTIAAASEGIGNMQVGDNIIVYLNNPNNTETVYTYTIDNRYVIDASNSAEVQALGNPPASKTVSQLTYYDCWQPYGINYREVFNADLTSTTTVSGNASFVGSEPPVANSGIQ